MNKYKEIHNLIKEAKKRGYSFVYIYKPVEHDILYIFSILGYTITDFLDNSYKFSW